MNKEEIAKKIQAEKDSYNREINRLQQEILKVKERHQRTIADLQNQKQQASKIKHECLGNQYNLSENIFKSVNEELNKFI